MRKILLYSGCTYSGCDSHEIIEVDDGTTDAELQRIAETYMWETLSPEYRWSEATEEDIEDYDD